jgi:hypothetical protein
VLGRRRREASRYGRLNRGRDASPEQRTWSITCSIGGFEDVGIPWVGDDEVHVRDSFLDYLHDDATYTDVNGRWPNQRSLYVRFNGRWKLLTFRTDWVAGFTVN